MTTTSEDDTQDETTASRNEVSLSGRVTSGGERRRLPSGDEIVTARIAVTRDPVARARSKQPSDAVDLVAWTKRSQRVLLSWGVGDRVEVEGHIRRRFWRGPQGVTSFAEVEVRSARRRKA